MTTTDDHPVTAAQLRAAGTRLLQAQTEAMQVLAGALAELPDMNASAWSMASLLDPERQQAARDLLERLGRPALQPA